MFWGHTKYKIDLLITQRFRIEVSAGIYETFMNFLE